MAFVKKTWKDRIAEFATRRLLTKADGSTELVSVSREEGEISEEGDAFSAENMNNLEERIEQEFVNVNNSLANLVPFSGIDTSKKLKYITSGSWTATEDCYAYVYATSTSDGQLATMSLDGVQIYRNGQTRSHSAIIPIKKGQTLAISSSSTSGYAEFYALL